MSAFRILTRQGDDKICILRAGRPQQPITGDITLFEFRNEVVGATCKCSLCLPLGLPASCFVWRHRMPSLHLLSGCLSPFSGCLEKHSGLLEHGVCLKATLRNSLESGKRWEGIFPSSYF